MQKAAHAYADIHADIHADIGATDLGAQFTADIRGCTDNSTRHP